MKPSGGHVYRDGDVGDTALPMPRVHLTRWADLFVALTIVGVVVPMAAGQCTHLSTASLATSLFGTANVIVTGSLGWRLVRGARMSPLLLLAVAGLPLPLGYVASWSQAGYLTYFGRAAELQWIAWLTTAVNVGLSLLAIGGFFHTIARRRLGDSGPGLSPRVVGLGLVALLCAGTIDGFARPMFASCCRANVTNVAKAVPQLAQPFLMEMALIAPIALLAAAVHRHVRLAVVCALPAERNRALESLVALVIGTAALYVCVSQAEPYPRSASLAALDVAAALVALAPALTAAARALRAEPPRNGWLPSATAISALIVLAVLIAVSTRMNAQAEESVLSEMSGGPNHGWFAIETRPPCTLQSAVPPGRAPTTPHAK